MSPADVHAEAAVSQARFLEVEAAVRYWEDAWLNGAQDTEGRMPLRHQDLWKPVIELATGMVLAWPEGQYAEVQYKVCDGGRYWLLNDSKQRIAQWKGSYVPDLLSVGSDWASGDYIELKVGPAGCIAGWHPPDLNARRWVLLSTSRLIDGVSLS